MCVLYVAYVFHVEANYISNNQLQLHPFDCARIHNAQILWSFLNWEVKLQFSLYKYFGCI